MAAWQEDHLSAFSKAVEAGAVEQHGVGGPPALIEKALSRYVDGHLGEIVALFLPSSNHASIEARIHTPDARELDLTITMSGLQRWSTIDWDDVVASLLLRYPENARMAA